MKPSFRQQRKTHRHIVPLSLFLIISIFGSTWRFYVHLNLANICSRNERSIGMRAAEVLVMYGYAVMFAAVYPIAPAPGFFSGLSRRTTSNLFDKHYSLLRQKIKQNWQTFRLFGQDLPFVSFFLVCWFLTFEKVESQICESCETCSFCQTLPNIWEHLNRNCPIFGRHLTTFHYIQQHLINFEHTFGRRIVNLAKMVSLERCKSAYIL